MRKVTILKGLPASNKSGWAKEEVLKHPGRTKRINKDDLRAMLDSSKHSKGNEAYVLQLRDHILLTSLDLGKNVIIDDTNFHPKHEERIRELVSGYNEGMYGNEPLINNKIQVEVKFFDVAPEECIKRDLVRPNSVGAKVIWNMYNEYLKPEAEKIEPLKQNESLPHAVICDLDGTVALKGDRDIYDWAKCDVDLPNKIVIDLVKRYSDTGAMVIFLSGRDGRGREKTIDWLGKYIGLSKSRWELFMRKPEDNRKDCIIKRELYDAHVKDKYYVDFVLDDRNQVVELWRSMGLTCLQVAEGDF